MVRSRIRRPPVEDADTGLERRAPTKPATGVLGWQQQAGNHAVAQVLQRRAAPPGKTAVRKLKAGDKFRVETSYGKIAREFSGELRVEANGTAIFGFGRDRIPVTVVGLTLQEAAQRLAKCLVDRELYVQPIVSLTMDGISATATYKAAKSTAQIAREKYLAYVADINPADPARVRYVTWLDAHNNSADLGRMTPVALWNQVLADPTIRQSPREEQDSRFRDFMLDQLKRDIAVKDPKELTRRHEIMTQFEAWLEKNKDAKDYLRKNPGTEYGRIAAKVIIKETKLEVAQDVAKRLAAKRNPVDPATTAERGAKFDEFLELAKKLWGYSARRFPYTIHLKAQRKDILFTGDPGTQRVLDDVAKALVQWASDHMMDSGFTTVVAQKVLDDLLGSLEFSKRLIDAQSKPEEHEYFDADLDTELKGRTFLESFGKTVFKGLTAIAIIGAVVGAEIITAGQATWLIAGLAATSGVQSYLGRRSEIEAGGYDVPVIETAITSLGDIVAVSQLIEGITGERLGTDMPLTGEERSGSLGEGAGGMFAIFSGSRAWRTGEAVGMRLRVPRRGQVPPGPDGRTTDVPDKSAQMPPEPRPSTKPGAQEAAARERLPEALKPGFDLWIEHLRVQPRIDLEKAVAKASPQHIERSSASHLRGYLGKVKKARDAAYLRRRAADDPLRPMLEHNEPVRGSDVWVHYEKFPPRAREIQHAVRLSTETGEPVHIFGDNASGLNYPGIDGTIGTTPRPMQFKEFFNPEASGGRARHAAEDALEAARTHGYSQVEVYIDMPHRTVAEVRAAWETGPTDMPPTVRRPVYEGGVIAKIRIKASDGTWQPPKAPSKTTLKVPDLPKDKEKDNKRRR